MRCAVVDLSHHIWESHGDLDFGAAKAAGVQAIIYKASEGATLIDPTYARSRQLAQAAGLTWGAFHFGTAAPLKDQLDNFFRAAAPDEQTLMCLDFEHNDHAPTNTMPAQMALDFLDAADGQLGRKITLYTGSYMFEAFGNAPVNGLRDRRLWWAQYSDNLRLHPTWERYWLWQYSDGVHGPLPREVDGFGPCDCNTFDGDDAELAASWIEPIAQGQA
jgi:lysozyme